MPIQVEYFADRTVQKKRDLIRRIRLLLDDVGFDTHENALHRKEILGKRFIRAILEPAEAENGLRIRYDFGREQVTSKKHKPNSHNPINNTSTNTPNIHPTEEPHITLARIALPQKLQQLEQQASNTNRITPRDIPISHKGDNGTQQTAQKSSQHAQTSSQQPHNQTSGY